MHRKQGFTLIEFVVGLTVLSFGALILATFAKISLNLQLASKQEREGNAQANQALQSSAGQTVSATVTFASQEDNNLLPPKYIINSKVAQADNIIKSQLLLSVEPYWIGNTFLHLVNEPLSVSNYADPLQLSGLKMPSDDTSEDSPAPFLKYSNNELTRNQTLSQEIVIFTNSFTIKNNASLVFRANSGQPTLIYVATDGIAINDAALSCGWYSVPCNSNIQELLNSSNNYRLDFTRYSLNISDLTTEQKDFLAQELDKAYARILLAGLEFSS